MTEIKIKSSCSSEKSDNAFGFGRVLGLLIQVILLPALIGCLSGLSGMVLAITLHFVQHLAYGYSLDAVISSESFLQGVTAASASRRFSILVLCGVVAGVGWYGLARFGRPLTSVGAAVGSNLTRMPFVETIVHGLLQMITVALGSPLGREVAPREWGALMAQKLVDVLHVPPDGARTLVACGAGAGLGAVYDVPIASTIFVMEVLLRHFQLKAFVSAAVSCTVAASLARTELGNDLQYSVPEYIVDGELILWAALIGVPFGAAGFAFGQWISKCSAKADNGASRIWKSLLSFSMVGLVATVLPQLLGNGKGPAQLAFANHLPLSLAAIIIAAKLLCLTLVLRSGAKGGLLTPGFSLGALSAVVVGGLVQPWFPIASTGSLAILGAAAFLSSSMAMPITAIFLAIEFMDAPMTFLLPIAIAVSGATIAHAILTRLFGADCRPSSRAANAEVRQSE